MASNQPTMGYGFEPEMQDISRQRDLAKMLLQKGMTDNLSGQMVSGRYVGASPLQGIANMYSAYQGKKLAEEADTKQAQLAEKLRMAQATEASDILKALKGTAGTADVIPEGQTLRDDEGNLTFGAQAGTPAIAGSRQAALAKALAGRSPFSQTMAAKLMEQEFKEPKWEKAELTDPKTGNTKQGWVDVNSPNPEATFRQGGEKPALSPMDIMKGRFEGWYTGGGVTGGGMPTGGVPTGGVSNVTGGQVPFSPQNAISPASLNTTGLSPSAAIQAKKEVLVDKAKRQAEYAEKAPAAIEMMGQTINNINDLIGDAKVVDGKVVYGKKSPHAGFEQSVGFGSAPLAKYIPGSDVSDFRARFDQIKGQSFLQAFETLKGGGQITEVEGAKATAALNRMNLAQSEKEFIAAAREFEENINKGMMLARQRAGLPQPTGQWRVK